MPLGPGPDQVTINPGVREDDLDAFLTTHNLMMKTVTAGGFFSLGGMTAVDVHGATVQAPIFAETASAFTIIGADGQEMFIDPTSPKVEGCTPLQFARVSLGGLGIVAKITLDVLPRPWATTLQGGKDRFLLKDKQAFVAKFKELTQHDRIETFYTPYAASPNLPPLVPDMKNYLALWWDVVDPETQTPNSASAPATECALSNESKFGAPLLGGIAQYAEPLMRKLQYADNAFWPLPIPPGPAAIAAIALDEVEKQVEQAYAAHSEFDVCGLGGRSVFRDRAVQGGDDGKPLSPSFINARGAACF